MGALRWLDRYFEELICCTCLVVIAVSVFSQVVARYIFEVALHWTEEVAAICMVWAYIIFIADFLWAFFCVFMLKVSWDYLAVLWKFTSHSPSLGINQFYPQSILFIGYALMLFRLAQYYLRWYRDGAEGLPGMLEDEWQDVIPDGKQKP